MASEKPTSQELAQQRTVWANERTRLANERTFATWIRTGLAILGVGFGIGKLLTLEPQWVIRGLAVAFMLVAGLIFVVAFHTSTASTWRSFARKEYLPQRPGR